MQLFIELLPVLLFLVEIFVIFIYIAIAFEIKINPLRLIIKAKKHKRLDKL